MMNGKREIQQAIKLLIMISALLGVSGIVLAEQSAQVTGMAVNHRNAVIAALIMLLLGLLVFFFRHKTQR